MVTKHIEKFALKITTLTLLAGCMFSAGATHAIAQETSPNLANEIAQEKSPSIAQVVALDECDPVTFNATPPAGSGADFCRNVALGYSTTLSALFTLAEAGTPEPGWDFEPENW